MKKLSQQQKIVIMGYTGITTTKFNSFHQDVEQRLGRPIFTIEFADPSLMEVVKEAYREDFLEMCREAMDE